MDVDYTNKAHVRGSRRSLGALLDGSLAFGSTASRRLLPLLARSNGGSHVRHGWMLMLLLAIPMSVGVAAVAATASAATEPGYPTATVQYGASTRTLPYIRSNTYWGYALRNPGANWGNQTASIACWYDADWATGNYRTNRWFKALVWESYDGYSTPRWLFVHASYVYNQPVVRKCYATSTGIW